MSHLDYDDVHYWLIQLERVTTPHRLPRKHVECRAAHDGP